MDGQQDTGSDLQAAALAYCDAVYFARAEVFEDLCHERFQMTLIENGQATLWDKPAYLARVAGRAPFEGAPVYEILSVDVAGETMAHVKLQVRVPPRLFEDYLGFFRVGGEWKLITKLFRTVDGPALEG